MELREELQKAIEFEKEGRNVYMEVAKTTFNPLVKKAFEFLAAEEERHIKQIQNYVENEKLPEPEGASKEDIKEFFKVTVDEFKEGIEFSADDKSAYEKAMELEKDSYNHYKEQLTKAEDEKLNDFFRFLMEQESSHYLMLEKTLKFVKDPQHFYAEQEDWSFEG
ncbi:MAG: ferritin family protein [Candidatus Nanoarchaeia archaeon]